jgi:hypothetical protein
VFEGSGRSISVRIEVCQGYCDLGLMGWLRAWITVAWLSFLEPSARYKRLSQDTRPNHKSKTCKEPCYLHTQIHWGGNLRFSLIIFFNNLFSKWRLTAWRPTLIQRGGLVT